MKQNHSSTRLQVLTIDVKIYKGNTVLKQCPCPLIPLLKKNFMEDSI